MARLKIGTKSIILASRLNKARPLYQRRDAESRKDNRIETARSLLSRSKEGRREIYHSKASYASADEKKQAKKLKGYK